MSLSAARADTTLTAGLDIGGTGRYVQLHIGSPGADGTANVAQDSAADAVRKLVTFAAPGNHATNTERRSLSSAAATWAGSEIDAAQNITHFSLWSAITGGNVEFIDAVTTPKTTGSDGVEIASGDIEVALEVFQKP